jgi:CMP-N-acetylneuraminic acid synthetase
MTTESRAMPSANTSGGAINNIALAVIPARGGSKRVPGKNIRALCGRPAIAYSIDAARESGLFARVIVSTDSEVIAEIAVRHGADVPFLREPALADDHVPVSAATVDALKRLDPDRATFTSVAQLMPNCPLRDAGDVRDSFRQFVLSGARSQLSVSRYGWQPPWWAMRRTPALTLVPLFPAEVVRRSQDLFCPTGAIWWAQADALREAGTYHIEGRTGWEIAALHALDIDTEEDWHLAEALMQQRRGADLEGAGLEGAGLEGAGSDGTGSEGADAREAGLRHTSVHGAGVGNGA